MAVEEDECFKCCETTTNISAAEGWCFKYSGTTTTISPALAATETSEGWCFKLGEATTLFADGVLATTCAARGRCSWLSRSSNISPNVSTRRRRPGKESAAPEVEAAVGIPVVATA